MEEFAEKHTQDGSINVSDANQLFAVPLPPSFESGGGNISFTPGSSGSSSRRASRKSFSANL